MSSTSASTDNTTSTSTSSASGAGGSQQQQVQQQQTAFNLAATNAFAAQQMPPGYAYYFGNMGNMGLQAPTAYAAGAATGPTPAATHVYPPHQAAMTSQFQKSYGTK